MRSGRAPVSKGLGQNVLLSSSPAIRLCCRRTKLHRRLKTEAVYVASPALQLLSPSVFLFILVVIFVSVSLSLSLYLSVSLSLSLCLSVSIPLSLSLCLSLCLCFCLCLSVSVSLSPCLSVSVSLSLLLCLCFSVVVVCCCCCCCFFLSFFGSFCLFPCLSAFLFVCLTCSGKKINDSISPTSQNQTHGQKQTRSADTQSPKLLMSSQQLFVLTSGHNYTNSRTIAGVCCCC